MKFREHDEYIWEEFLFKPVTTKTVKVTISDTYHRRDHNYGFRELQFWTVENSKRFTTSIENRQDVTSENQVETTIENDVKATVENKVKATKAPVENQLTEGRKTKAGENRVLQSKKMKKFRKIKGGKRKPRKQNEAHTKSIVTWPIIIIVNIYNR